MLFLPGSRSKTAAASAGRDTKIAEQSGHGPLVFEEVYDACFPFVWRTARRLGVPDEALDDVCQEVFVVVHRRLSDFEGRAKIETWLYRITENAVRNHRRTFRRRALRAQGGDSGVEPDEIPAQLPGPELRAERSEATRLAREILMSLAEPRRIAFALVDLEGMSYQEAAESLGESVHTVRARVRAARADFERRLRRLHDPARPHG